MQAMGGGPTTPVEQISELGDAILEKLIAAGITTVEELADMTPEQLEEIPGIGEKTLEKIGVAVRNYFSRFEEAALAAEGDEGLAATAPVPEAGETTLLEGAAEETPEAAETSEAGAVLAEDSIDNAEPPLAGKETEEDATEEAEAENSAEVIEEAVSTGDVEAEEEQPAKENGA